MTEPTYVLTLTEEERRLAMCMCSTTDMTRGVAKVYEKLKAARNKPTPHASAFRLYRRMVGADRDTRDFEIGVAMLAAYFDCPADWLGVADAAACKGWNN